MKILKIKHDVTTTRVGSIENRGKTQLPGKVRKIS